MARLAASSLDQPRPFARVSEAWARIPDSGIAGAGTRAVAARTRSAAESAAEMDAVEEGVETRRGVADWGRQAKVRQSHTWGLTGFAPMEARLLANVDGRRTSLAIEERRL